MAWAGEGPAADGFVFYCSDSTQAECLERQLFGSPRSEWSRLASISQRTAIFLYNFKRKRLHGVFWPTGPPALDIVPSAWTPDGGACRFPAQLTVQRATTDVAVLSKTNLGGITLRAGPVSAVATRELLKLFGSGEVGGGAAAAAAPPPPPPPDAPAAPPIADATSPAREMPIWHFAEALQKKCMLNRVTLIVGSTGCGKSTQVPQILQRGIAGKILCTQPRRLAVVAIASRVAQECGTELGEQVGYQIGQRRAARDSTQLEFCTAGILLERLKMNGEQALAAYKVLIVDEVHERSPESDLMLACVRQFMMGRSAAAAQLHLVLMSATPDLFRFQEYFRPVLSAAEQGTVDVCHVDQVSRAVDSARLWQTRVKYLDHVRGMLKLEEGSPRRGNSVGGVDAFTIFHLISHLISGKDKEGGTILVFLPTYRHLEEQYRMLAHLRLSVHILHSSIEIEECMASLRRSGSQRQWKIVLATNIAESSVTIDGVMHVIDSCKTNCISLHLATRTERQTLVNVSQSQADQRKGRTGRTCDGTVWRMCTRRQFDAFDKFETPALQLQSLEPQSLILLSSASRVMSQAEKLFGATLDAPHPERVSLAMGTLVSMGAATALPRGRSGKVEHRVTTFGRLLAEMPVSIRSARLAIAGAMTGVMRESAVCAAVLSCTPQPILRPFNEMSKYIANLRRFSVEGVGACDDDGGGLSGAEVDLSDSDKVMCNFLAYEFWQSQFIRPKLLSAAHEEEFTPPLIDRDEEDAWCERFGLCRSALHDVHETANVIVSVLHRIRPAFLHSSPGLLRRVRCGNHGAYAAPAADEARAQNRGVSSFCAAFWDDRSAGASSKPPAVSAEQTVLQLVESALGPLSAMPMPDDEETHGEEEGAVCQEIGRAAQETKQTKKKVCLFYRQGRCTRGAACQFAHPKGAAGSSARPICQFYKTREGCRFGAACAFSHGAAQDKERAARKAQGQGLTAQVQAAISRLNVRGRDESGRSSDGDGPSRLELDNGETVVLVGEGDFSYALHLASVFDSVDGDLIATGLDEEDDVLTTYASAEQTLSQLRDDALGDALHVELGFGVNACNPLNDATLDLLGQADKVVWNFPFAGADGDGESNTYLMQRFFHCCFSSRAVSYRCGASEPELEIYVTLCNDQYVRWGLAQVAENAFFYLRTSFAFDLDGLGAYEPRRNFTESTFSVERATTYVFAMQPVFGTAPPAAAIC